MSLPIGNLIKSIQVPSGTTYEIIPERLKNGSYEATLPTLTQDSTIALTSDIKNSTITLTQGGVTKGSFTLNQNSDATISLDAGGGSIDYNDLDNIPIENVLSGTTYEDGRYYKKADESGVLLPFNSDDYVSYVYCDTSKSSELSSLLATFDYSQVSGTLGACYLVEGRGDWGMYALKDTSSGTNYIVAILTDNLHPIYATGSGSIDIGMGAVSYVSGWQNLDSDDRYSLGGSVQIRGAYQDGWNGVILGKDIGTVPGAIARYESGVLNDLLTKKDKTEIESEIETSLNGLVVDGLNTVSATSLIGQGSVSYSMPSSVFDKLVEYGKLKVLRIKATYSSYYFYIYFNVTAISNEGSGDELELGNIGNDSSFYFSGHFRANNLSQTLYYKELGTSDLSQFAFGGNIKTLYTTSTTQAKIPTGESIYDGNSAGQYIWLHDVAKTGSYNDLLNKPTIPTTYVESVNGSSGAITGVAMTSDLHSHSNKSVLDNIATQTAYTSKGTSTKVPTITTNTSGQVTSITETSIAFPVTSVNGNTGAITGLATTSDLTNVAYKNVNNNFSTSQSMTSAVLSNGTPLQFTGYGTGTYNRGAFVCNTTDKFGVECPRETDSGSGTIVPFRIGVRGGQLGNLQTGSVSLGSNSSTTTSATISYNTTTQSLDFTF